MDDILGTALAFGGIDNEYDPSVPHNYDQIIRAREHAQRVKEAERQKILSQELNAASQQFQAPRYGDGAFSLSSLSSKPPPADYERDLNAPSTQPSSSANPFAMRMLREMGWAEGHGLGRQLQGITAPLTVQKSDSRSGVIVQNQDVFSSSSRRGASNVPIVSGREGGQDLKDNVPAEGSDKMNNFVRIKNIQPSGTTDAELIDSIAELAASFGSLIDVFLAKKNTGATITAFCQFESVEDAAAASNSLRSMILNGKLMETSCVSEQVASAEL